MKAQFIWTCTYGIYHMYLNCAVPSNSTAVCYYLSTINLDFVINFNCGAPLNSATFDRSN